MKGTQRARILAALADGPASSTELAIETGLSLKHCSAYLYTLKREGLVIKSETRVRSEPCAECGHQSRLAYVFTLAELDGRTS